MPPYNSFGCVALHISFALGSMPAGVASEVALFAIWYEYGIFCPSMFGSLLGWYPYRLYSHISPSLPSGLTAAGMSCCFVLNSCSVICSPDRVMPSWIMF